MLLWALAASTALFHRSPSAGDHRGLNAHSQVNLHAFAYPKGPPGLESPSDSGGCVMCLTSQCMMDCASPFCRWGWEGAGRELPDSPLALLCNCLQVWCHGLVNCLRVLPLFGVSKMGKKQSFLPLLTPIPTRVVLVSHTCGFFIQIAFPINIPKGAPELLMYPWADSAFQNYSLCVGLHKQR